MLSIIKIRFDAAPVVKNNTIYLIYVILILQIFLVQIANKILFFGIIIFPETLLYLLRVNVFLKIISGKENLQIIRYVMMLFNVEIIENKFQKKIF